MIFVICGGLWFVCKDRIRNIEKFELRQLLIKSISGYIERLFRFGRCIYLSLQFSTLISSSAYLYYTYICILYGSITNLFINWTSTFVQSQTSKRFDAQTMYFFFIFWLNGYYWFVLLLYFVVAKMKNYVTLNA